MVFPAVSLITAGVELPICKLLTPFLMATLSSKAAWAEEVKINHKRAIKLNLEVVFKKNFVHITI
jgi:hypothetical protein